MSSLRCCHAAGFEPSVSFESDDYHTVQGLVAAGVGVALIPQLALSAVREDIVTRSKKNKLLNSLNFPEPLTHPRIGPTLPPIAKPDPGAEFAPGAGPPRVQTS